MDFIVGFLMCSVDMLDKKDVICHMAVNDSIKNNTFAYRLALLFNNFKLNSVQKFSRIKLYYALAVSFISYGSGIWTLRKKNKNLTSMEIKFFRRTAGYTLFDHRRNEEILEEMKVEPFDKKLRRYKSDWLRHVKRN